jgi:hypothetical protein
LYDLLSKTETIKKTTKKIKVRPQARWTDPFGSSLHEPKTLDMISDAASEPYMDSSALLRGDRLLAMVN